VIIHDCRKSCRKDGGGKGISRGGKTKLYLVSIPDDQAQRDGSQWDGSHCCIEREEYPNVVAHPLDFMVNEPVLDGT
jgi:hypothetical protein